MTDGNPRYANLDDYFHCHHAVDHNKEFVRAIIIHTNSAKSYHSLLKRSLIGRYVDEFFISLEHAKRNGRGTHRAGDSRDGGKRPDISPVS
jgi:hypothetical protein